MSLNSNVSKELALHPAQRLWVPALELSKRLQKAKRARASEWTKNHRHRVEPSPPGKVVKRHPIQREPPASALRPIDNHGALAEVRQDVLLDMVVPNWTVGIHKQDVPPTDAPPRPNDDVQANGGDDEKHQPEHCNDHDERKKGNDQGALPPSCFRFGLWSAHDVRVGLTSLSEAQPVERKPPRSEHAAMELKSHGKILTLRAVGSTGLVANGRVQWKAPMRCPTQSRIGAGRSRQPKNCWKTLVPRRATEPASRIVRPARTRSTKIHIPDESLARPEEAQLNRMTSVKNAADSSNHFLSARLRMNDDERFEVE